MDEFVLEIQMAQQEIILEVEMADIIEVSSGTIPSFVTGNSIGY